MIVSDKAKRRLEAIYRQHQPNQPPLDVSLHLGATAANERARASRTQCAVRAAVLDEPLYCQEQSTAPDHKQNGSWPVLRDVHSEICVTCNTLRKLQLLHGTIVEVISNIWLCHTCFGHCLCCTVKLTYTRCRSPIRKTAQLWCVLLECSHWMRKSTGLGQHQGSKSSSLAALS